MGYLERESKKRTVRANIQKAILHSIAAAGAVSIALIAPNALQMLKLFGIDSKSKWRKYSVNNSIKRLKEKGYIYFEITEKGNFIRLTEKGKKKLDNFKLLGYKLKKPNRWDGKWRMLIFDIKEERKGTRDRIRSTLNRLGFLRLQDSVWVYPYDCEDFITLMKADFKIGYDLLYLIVDSIEGDKRLRSHFKLLK